MQCKNNDLIELIVTPQSSSNLIFNYHERGMSSLSLPNSIAKTKANMRQHSIMLLRKSRKQCHLKENYSQPKPNPINLSQYGVANKVNVINFMSYNSQSPKIKSNYCKKITLTNVQKYYEFCLKKVKFVNKVQIKLQSPQQKIMIVNNKSRPETPVRRSYQRQQASTPQLKKSISYNNSPNTFSKSVNLRKKQQNGQSNFSRLLSPQNEQDSQIGFCKRIHFKQQVPLRNIKSSHFQRPHQRMKDYHNRKLLNTSQKVRNNSLNRYNAKNKNQFVIDGWQAQDQPVDDIF